MIELAPFGRTGHQSTRLLFGAAALGGMSQERSDSTMALVDAAGINHIDTAAGYGTSEERLKPFLATNRDRFFLATKTNERSGAGARAGLEHSLERMGVDSVDLIQLHNLVEQHDWDTAHARNGAVAALAQARDEGLVRHIGVTGHGIRIARMHLQSLKQFDFDSVLFPYNHSLLQNRAYRSDVEDLIGVCNERQVATQTIKSIARGRWIDPNAPHFSWYEPLVDPDAITRAVHYVLGTPGLFLNTTSDARLLPIIIEAANSVGDKPTDSEMDTDIESFGITPLFDGASLELI